MSEPSNSRGEAAKYGPKTREEAIAGITRSRRKVSSYLHGLSDDVGPPETEESAFGVVHATMISQWVEESQFRGFFELEREANENAIQDLEEVLYGEETVASATENSHVPREHCNLAILQHKWVWLARECMQLARLFSSDFVSLTSFIP